MAELPLIDRMFARCREARGAYGEMLTDLQNGVLHMERGLKSGPTTDVVPLYITYLEGEIAALDAVLSEYEATHA